MIREEDEGSRIGGGDPIRRVDEIAARDAVGMETYVFVEEIVRLLLAWMRDSVVLRPAVAKQENRKVPVGGPRDEIGESGPSP